MPGLHVSGVLVSARPELAGAVRERLESVSGVEVRAVTPEGRLVAVVERADDRGLADAFTDIRNTSGVLSASLVYHYSDNDCAPEQEITS